MKYFIKTQIITIAYIICIFISWDILRLFEFGIGIALLVIILITKFIAHERWITILYVFINFILDTFIIYKLVDYFGDSSSIEGFYLFFIFPILLFFLIFGTLIGVAASIKLEE